MLPHSEGALRARILCGITNYFFEKLFVGDQGSDQFGCFVTEELGDFIPGDID
jgi:hypothetical protein